MKIVNLIEKHPVLTIIITVILMLCFSISALDVTIMEARNFITAREMLTDQNWLLTTMNEEPRYQKPPLPTWLTAISVMIFGMKSLLAMRLPAIIMVIVLGILVYLLSLKLVNNKQHSLINALIALSSFYIIGIIIEAPWDIFTHGFMLIAIYSCFQLFSSPQVQWKWALIGALGMGASVLSKGPVSIYALFLPFVLSYGFSYKFRDFKSKWLPSLTLFIFGLVIGGWWYAYVRLEDPQTFIDIANKETGNWGSYNVRPFYYYWSFFTQSGLWTLPAFISLLYPYLKDRVSNKQAYKFSFLWTWLAVILLSIIPEKKSRYLMPVLIPLAINIGFYIHYLICHFKTLKDKRETWPVYFNFGLIGVIGCAFPIAGYVLLKDHEAVNWIRFVFASLLLVILGYSILYHLRQKALRGVFYSVIGFFVAAFLGAIPLSKHLKATHGDSLVSIQNTLNKEQLKLYSLNYVAPEAIWNYGQSIPSIQPETGDFRFPDAATFGLAINSLSDLEKSALEAAYTLEKIGTYDLNPSKKDSRSYRTRLVSDIYILRKR